MRLAIVGCLCLLCVGCKPKSYRYMNASMEPTIKKGEVIFVNMSAYSTASPQRWDVVVFHPPQGPTDTWVMRIVGLPGESVSFSTGGISIDGKPLAPPGGLSHITYVSLDKTSGPGLESPIQVPANAYFVLGDKSTTPGTVASGAHFLVRTSLAK